MSRITQNFTTKADAACPELTHNDVSPPSRAATLSSSTFVVEIIILVNILPNSFNPNKLAVWSIELN